MTDRETPDRIEGDPGEANRGIGQEIVGEPAPGPVQRPPYPPAAGGPGTGVGETEPVGERAPIRGH